MSNFTKSLIAVVATVLLTEPQPLHSETYTIKKLNTPTININNTPMKVGDTFTDGAVIRWQSGTQAMRVLNSHSEPICLRATGTSKPIRMRTLVAGIGKLSTRAICTSPADHRQAFEGVNGKPHQLLDTLTFTSSWKQDDNNYFEMSIPSDGGKRIVKLPCTDNGEIIIARSMFPIADEEQNKETSVKAEISYILGKKGETRVITSDMRITILPDMVDDNGDK